MSVLSVITACLIVMGLMSHRLLQARRQKVPSEPVIPGCVMRMCWACFFLAIAIVLVNSIDWLNVTFHFYWEAGSWRNFLMAPAALGFGVVLWRNFGRLLETMHFERLKKE